MKILLTIFLTILASEQFANGYRILGVFPLCGKSHWVVAEALMKGLARRGHQVDVIGHFPLKEPFPNYKDIVISGPIERAVNNMTANDIKAFDGLTMSHFVSITGNKICNLIERPELMNVIKNPPQDPPYDIVITELFTAPCYIAYGRHLKVPVVGIVASALHDWLFHHVGIPLNTAFVPSLFSPYTHNMTFWQRVKNTLQTNFINTQIDYFTNAQIEHVKNYFGISLGSIQELYKDLALVLVNSHHSMHGIKPQTHAVVEVGGIHVSEEPDPLSPEVQKWLDESKHGCVLFTFGSMVRIETFPKETIEIIYKVFEEIAPVRVLMKIAKKEDLLPGLPKNVMIQPWLPQVSILKHKNTKAFITHGGLMGTTEAIYHGVPMVGIPLFGDQHLNIQNYVRKNIAISLQSSENVTYDGLSNALKTILHDPQYRDNVKRLSKLFMDRPMSAIDTALYWVEYVARNGYILQSPAIHLSCWKRNLLDVYGFLTLCLVVLLYVVVLILRVLKKLIFGSKGCPMRNQKDPASKKNK